MDTNIFQRGNFVVLIQNSKETIIPINNFDYDKFTADTIAFKDVIEKNQVTAEIATIKDEAGVLIGDYTALVAYLSYFNPSNGIAEWELIPDNNIDLIYYSGVEAGNPSGNVYNVKNRIYKQGTTAITTIIYTYDSLDRIINIGN